MTPATLARVDPIVARIVRAVPHRLDPALRDDVISEVYLAIREGQLHPRDIDQQIGRFISMAFALWSNRWGTVSLHVGIGEDGPDFVEMVEDDGALAAFDRITFPHEEQLH